MMFICWHRRNIHLLLITNWWCSRRSMLERVRLAREHDTSYKGASRITFPRFACTTFSTAKHVIETNMDNTKSSVVQVLTRFNLQDVVVDTEESYMYPRMCNACISQTAPTGSRRRFVWLHLFFSFQYRWPVVFISARDLRTHSKTYVLVWRSYNHSSFLRNLLLWSFPSTTVLAIILAHYIWLRTVCTLTWQSNPVLATARSCGG